MTQNDVLSEAGVLLAMVRRMLDDFNDLSYQYDNDSTGAWRSYVAVVRTLGEQVLHAGENLKALPKANMPAYSYRETIIKAQLETVKEAYNKAIK